MEIIKKTKRYKVKEKYLDELLKEYWHIPSDVLQRGIEANAWSLCNFKRPILDIGIGNGKMTKLIFGENLLIDVGIDSESKGLEEARLTRKYKKVLHANAEKMPFENSSFNMVISNSTFEHIKNDTKAISEVSRVLKKDGYFLTTAPTNYLKKWILEYENHRRKPNANKNLLNFNKRTNHLHYRSLNDWVKNFKKNKLEIVFCKYYLPKKVAILWYKLFKIFTYKILGKEAWSILSNPKIVRFIPRGLIVNSMKQAFLKKAYEQGFFVNSGEGAQLFIVAKKI